MIQSDPIQSDAIQSVRATMRRVFLGSPDPIDHLLIGLFARGHVLIEDVPGVGKTVLANALARSVTGSFSRVQLTPDMMPADIIGSTVYRRSSESFEFMPGPIFANVVLADELNRTPPRTQTALLEAMSEATVTVDGQTRELPRPFMVVATQNPSGFQGAYPLPENQLDRFLLRISLGYPTAEAEAQVLTTRPAETELSALEPALTVEQVRDLQRRVDDVRMDPSIVDYIVAIAKATREHEEIRLGLSPRGSMALAHACRARAIVLGREHVIPEDVVELLGPVAAHRIIPRGSTGLADDPALARRLLDDALEQAPSPA